MTLDMWSKHQKPYGHRRFVMEVPKKRIKTHNGGDVIMIKVQYKKKYIYSN